jgi:hypothetical protein
VRISLESTSRIVELNGVRARVWQGKTASGIPVAAFITSIVVERTEDTAAFDRELLEHAEPRADLREFPARMAIDYEEDPR